ncbi:MAG: helix-turn-helix domain-containing protein [Halobacteria archaeon]|nr:helix-turn-helix domain-containing protein [Halobacteria archaeon]
MPRSRIRIHVPGDGGVKHVSKSYPDSTFKVVSVLPRDSNGKGLIEIESDDVESILSELSERDDVDEETLHVTDSEAVVEFEVPEPKLMVAARRTGVPLETPFEIRDGEAVWTVRADHSSLSDLGSFLDQNGIEYDLEYMKEIETERRLTERQREVLEVAVDEGYYDVPREATLTEVSEVVGISKSSCSEILQRAESRIVPEFVE